MTPRALVVRTAGTNCDGETAHALALAGFDARFLHVNRLLENAETLRDFQLLALPGGFSYGDDISAGRIFANQITHHLRDPFHQFVSAGKPIIGICNGFQVLVKTDLLPGPAGNRPGKPAAGTGQTCTLTGNDAGRFIDRWVHVAPASNRCIWTAGILPMELPIAHGEGKFVCADQTVRQSLHDNDQIALLYTRPDGSPASGEPPFNPNGSTDDIAGVCDATGVVLGLMPHPERFVTQFQHPAWSSRAMLDRSIDPAADGPGLQFFRNAFRHVHDAVGAGV